MFISIILGCLLLLARSFYPPTALALMSPTYQNITVYSGDKINPQFAGHYDQLSCVMPSLFTYSQTPAQFDNNTPYYLKIQSSSLSAISISTKYNNFQPSLGSTSCLFNCVVEIFNNCPNPFDKGNYFDEVFINVNGVIFSYLVDCNSEYFPSVFEWGLLVIIIFITILITMSSIYSRAWSLGGFGIKVGYLFISIYTAVFITGGVLAVFYPAVINDVVNGFCWILGIVSVGLCTNEILFPLKIKFLLKPLLGVIRVMDFFSTLVGLGFTIGWWLSNKNWIMNDIIAVCICISFIKIFKIVNLKMALVYMIIIVSTEITIALCIHFILGQSYNILILNTFNNPFEIQLPTITKVLNLRCSWIPITEIIFPGIFLSYTRRFDDSRNTHMYLIVSCITFLLASMGWMMVSLLNFHSWPLDTFTQPLLILIVVLFATKRNEIRTVWDGKFYDVEFVNKQDIKAIEHELVRESREVEMNTMMLGLRVDEERSSSLSESQHPLPLIIPEQL